MLVLFDLPTQTQQQRREYSIFRKKLISLGLTMVQYSVYIKNFPSEDSTHSVRNRIRQLMPGMGQVRILLVTDKQFSKMEILQNRHKLLPEERPSQILLF